MKHLLFIFLSSITMVSTGQIKKHTDLNITWKEAAFLPATGNERSIGVAGPINGISNDVFIVAGGANFPAGMPWEGGAKAFHDEIFMLGKNGNDLAWNKAIKSKLPEPIAYCGVVSTGKGIVYAGGENASGISDKVHLLHFDKEQNEVLVESLARLPVALTNVAAAHIGNIIYLAGGDEKSRSSKRFISLDLNSANEQWQSLPDLPVELANASLIAMGKRLYLVGGRSKTDSGISDLHHTTFEYDFKSKTWERRADICDAKDKTNWSASAGVAINDRYILMVGGDDGNTFHRIETLIRKINTEDDASEKESLTAEKNSLVTGHTGFSKKLLLYDTKEDCWTTVGEYPFMTQVTTNAVKWNNKIVVSNGEIKPGVRTPSIIIGTIDN